MKPYEIRSRFPELSLIGLSTHNPDQTRASRNEPIDYIGVGPVYSTPTKEIPDPTLGLETMRQMIDISSHPAVAIGGIDAVRLKEVVKFGAKNVAVVRAVCASSNPYEAMKTLAEIIMGE
jgi:thiamine-phosphate pyrophosphorylase